MSIQQLAEELDDLLKCSICVSAVYSPIYQCSNGHLICLKCMEHIEKSPPLLKICPSCGESLDGKRNRNLVAEALLTLFPTSPSDDKTTVTTTDDSSQSHHSNIDEIVTYKIICKEASVFCDQDMRQNAMIKLPRYSYVEVISIIDVPNEHTVIGNLKTGGWIILNNSSTGEIFAIPLDIGVYKNQSINSQVTTKFDINSEKKGILEKDVFFDVVRVRYCSQNNLVRAQLSTGSWVNLINGKTGENFAKPLQLGAYVTNDANEAYFDVIEISHAPENHRVRGNLPTGEWFSLVNTEEGTWAAHALKLGIYRIITPSTNVYGGLGKDSPKIKTLNINEIVDVLLVLTVPDSDMIRGKITTGGWIDLIDNEKSLVYAEHFKLGLYQIESEIHTTEQLDLKSKSLITIGPGNFIDICEICYLVEENCVRGRSKSEGWISLYNTLDEKSFATPVPLGTYYTLEGVSNTENEMVESQEIKFCSSCTFCDVIELKKMDEDYIIRGKLSSGGWINICKTTDDMQRWAEHISNGIYEINIENKATFALDLDSETLYEVKEGTLMEVIETRVTENNTHVRGKVSSGGWVTLISTDGSVEWAKPLYLGIYKTTIEQKIYEQSHKKSSRKKIAAGRVVVVTQLRLLPNLNVVRGKLDIEGWLDIVNVDEKKYFVKPLPLGRYKITSKTFQSSGPSIKSKVGKKMKKGTIIDVSYIQIMSEDQRVRARLMTGGWISLMSTSDGYEWAEYIG